MFDIVKAVQSFLGLAQKQDETNRKFRLDDSIEEKLVKMLSHSKYRKRTFKTIQRKIGGFDKEPDELRKHLVRIGADRSGTPGGGELWELPSEKRNNEARTSGNDIWMRIGVIAAIVSAVVTVLEFLGFGPSTWFENLTEIEQWLRRS